MLNFKNQTSGQGQRGEPGVGFNLTSDGNYDMVNKKLVNVADGTASSDTITKKNQLDTKLSKHGRIMTGNLNMNDKRIYNLAQPDGDKQPATKIWSENTFLSKSSGVMAGNLNLSNMWEQQHLIKMPLVEWQQMGDI